ncbi:MAG: hypothetical protein ABIY55_00555, partial [Kofleriaceae bacterium]
MQSLLARPARSWTAMLATTLLALGACGGGDGTPATPDAAPPPPPPPVPTPLTIRTYAEGAPFTGPPSSPPLVAFQDGDGAWGSLSGTSGVYQVTAQMARFGIAIGCSSAEHATLALYYRAPADGADVQLTGCPPAIAQVHLTVTLSNLAAGETAVVAFGHSVIGLFSAPDMTTLTADVAKGAEDGFVVVVGGPDGARAVQRVARLGRTALDSDQTLQLDAGAVALAPETHAAMVVGAETQEAVTRSSRYSTGAARFNVTLSQLAPPDSYLTVNAAARKPGDLTSASVAGERTLADGNLYTRFAQQTVATPIDVVLELPPRFLAAPPMRGEVASPRTILTLLATKDLLPFSGYAAALATAAAGGATDQRVTMTVSSAWIGASPFSPMVVPDL